MRRKTWLAPLLAGLVLLAGCGEGPAARPEADGGRETVTVALWSDQLTERYGTYLREAFPEVDFSFYVATNSTDFYRFKERHGDLPDILTVRRFALRDVADWRDSLLDLSDSQLANTFPQSYLRSYTYSDGTVNWLPACAEVDGILVNRELVEENGISLPTDDQTFLDACAAIKELGIRPFQSNFEADYTCMEILQGLSVSSLTSQAGREWRQRYESGQTDELSEDVWLPVFERMLDFIGYAGITRSDLEGDTAEIFDDYKSRRTAMIRGTCDEAVKYGAEEGTVMIPYCGEAEENSWYLTYPAFQVAASAGAEESPARKQLIFDIMEAMLNQEGLRHIATGENMIAYNRGVELAFSPLLAPMQSCLDSNRLYIRLASADMFSASREVVQGMITGEYSDARSAYDAFNEAMRADGGAAPAAAHIGTGYAYAFRPDGGSQAASAVMNTLREELGTQLLVGQSVNVAGNIAAGDYTEAELGFLTMGETVDILLCRMTGGQLYAYLDGVLAASGRRGAVVNDSALYVSSGFEMEIRRTEDGYALDRLTAGGEELERESTYSVAVLGNETLMHKDLLAAAGVTDYTRSDRAYKQILVDRLAGGGQLAGPADYITLK